MSDLQIELATALRDFYHFLAKLPWVEPDDILEPPEQGWPNINTENFRAFKKNSAVIELLKHLPYIRMDGPNDEYEFAWRTSPCDYRRKYFHDMGPEIDCWEIPDMTGRDFTIPEWVVALFHGKVLGQFIMLDTTDGTVMRYEPQWIRDPVFQAADPRAWRNECANPGKTERLSNVLDEWKEEYASLRWIRVPGPFGTRIWGEEDGDQYEELRQLMIRHGWPDDFDREGCKKAMLEWRPK
ncbi:hypothetical protein K491DRAFT_668733 [Lophiostoma macrostomum CBS 122681]|uniref:Uncharacterized protein n=1 Tax=Lophiostoma macrostomum CBS 122681 TaxID=1314788 RepID=A0A6A6SNY8_9PLEO|nr:hypothetical protein K491DRAFT_668733 [Lophiostoma macrostomum CBS 122681]